MTVLLEMDSMSNAEIVAMGSFTLQLRQRHSSPKKTVHRPNWQIQPTPISSTHGDEAKQTFEKIDGSKVRSGGGKIRRSCTKRRDLEERVMFGDILLDN